MEAREACLDGSYSIPSFTPYTSYPITCPSQSEMVEISLGLLFPNSPCIKKEIIFSPSWCREIQNVCLSVSLSPLQSVLTADPTVRSQPNFPNTLQVIFGQA